MMLTDGEGKIYEKKKNFLEVLKKLIPADNRIDASMRLLALDLLTKCI